MINRINTITVKSTIHAVTIFHLPLAILNQFVIYQCFHKNIDNTNIFNISALCKVINIMLIM